MQGTLGASLLVLGLGSTYTQGSPSSSKMTITNQAPGHLTGLGAVPPSTHQESLPHPKLFGSHPSPSGSFSLSLV